MYAARLTGRGAKGNTEVDDDSEPGWDVLPHVLYGHACGIRAFSEAANAVTQKLSDSERPGSRKDSGCFAFGGWRFVVVGLSVVGPSLRSG
jgi:hypothetical protein